jgi:tripartite-type tricarboxylate transporter receptor subunit TctC
VLTALFLARANVDALHIPYQGSGPAMAALLGGQVHFAIETLAAAGTLIREGKLKAYGSTSGRRSRLAPDIPPLAEAADMPGYDYTGWIGLMAPAATPPAIIAQIAAAVEQIAAQPDTHERLTNIGTEAFFAGPDAFRQVLAEYRTNFGAVIRQLGISAE